MRALITAVALLLGTFAASSVDARTVTVRVQVLDEAGEPVRVPVRVGERVVAISPGHARVATNRSLELTAEGPNRAFASLVLDTSDPQQDRFEVVLRLAPAGQLPAWLRDKAVMGSLGALAGGSWFSDLRDGGGAVDTFHTEAVAAVGLRVGLWGELFLFRPSLELALLSAGSLTGDRTPIQHADGTSESAVTLLLVEPGLSIGDFIYGGYELSLGAWFGDSGSGPVVAHVAQVGADVKLPTKPGGARANLGLEVEVYFAGALRALLLGVDLQVGVRRR